MGNRLVSNYNYTNIGGLNQPSCENVTYEIWLLDEYLWHTVYKTNIMLRCGPENIHVPQDMALAKMIKPWMDRNTISSDKATVYRQKHTKTIKYPWMDMNGRNDLMNMHGMLLVYVQCTDSQLPFQFMHGATWLQRCGSASGTSDTSGASGASSARTPRSSAFSQCSTGRHELGQEVPLHGHW